jgi:hypothetical protein
MVLGLGPQQLYYVYYCGTKPHRGADRLHTVRATAAAVADITLPELLHGQARELFGD